MQMESFNDLLTCDQGTLTPVGAHGEGGSWNHKMVPISAYLCCLVVNLANCGQHNPL